MHRKKNLEHFHRFQVLFLNQILAPPMFETLAWAKCNGPFHWRASKFSSFGGHFSI